MEHGIMQKDEMKIVTTAPEALKILWREKIFLKLNKVEEIEAELKKRGYNFPEKALLMALKRASFLTRKGSRGSFTYIQKHPFIDEIGASK
jgi:hypothetical protein